MYNLEGGLSFFFFSFFNKTLICGSKNEIEILDEILLVM